MRLFLDIIPVLFQPLISKFVFYINPKEKMSKFNELIKGEIPVIVNFYAEWAPTCDDVAERLREFKAEMGEDLKMIKIDFDKNEGIARKLNVVGIPTAILFKEGKVLLKQSGEVKIDDFKEKLNG